MRIGSLKTPSGTQRKYMRTHLTPVLTGLVLIAVVGMILDASVPIGAMRLSV
jgi:hypothetical protein